MTPGTSDAMAEESAERGNGAFSHRYPRQLNVRAAEAVVPRVEAAIGVALPSKPNTVASNGRRNALWLGPDEWLIVDEPGVAARDGSGVAPAEEQGVAPPGEPGSAAAGGAGQLSENPGRGGADEMRGGGSGANALEAVIRDAFAPDWGAVTDVSANRALIELSGLNAREVLAHGCSLDLHPRRFGPGDCAQTLLGAAQVILWQTDAAPTFRILVRASFADHLARWLVDATNA
jgi:sarcosine oxidase subunit gamma